VAFQLFNIKCITDKWNSTGPSRGLEVFNVSIERCRSLTIKNQKAFTRGRTDHFRATVFVNRDTTLLIEVHLFDRGHHQCAHLARGLSIFTARQLC